MQADLDHHCRHGQKTHFFHGSAHIILSTTMRGGVFGVYADKKTLDQFVKYDQVSWCLLTEL